MKYAYYGFGMLLFGSIGLVLIVMLQSVTINNDAEYYDLKEAMRAAMLEAVDYECYRTDAKSEGCGYTLKISEQKFVENFTKRFVTTVGGDAKGYTLEFYDIIESPPKASVVIKGMTKKYGLVSENEKLTITNSLSGILELKRGISTKYNYHSPIIIPEENFVIESSFETKEDKYVENNAVGDIEIEADDELCNSNKGNVEMGCAPQNEVSDYYVDDSSDVDENVDEEKNDSNEKSDIIE